MSRRLLALLALFLAAGCATTAPGRGPESDTGDPPSASAETHGLRPAGEALLIQGVNERRAGDYRAASATLERALRIEPSAAVLWLELARVRLMAGDTEQAEQLARKAHSLAGDDASVAGQAEEIVSEATRQ